MSFSVKQVENIKPVEYGCMIGDVGRSRHYGYGGSGSNKGLAVYAPTVQAYIDLMEGRYGQAKHDRSSVKSGTDGGWRAFSSWEEAIDVFRHRPHTIVTMEEINEEINAPGNIGTDFYYDVTGDFLDVDRHLDGEPEAFGVMDMGYPRGLFATVVVQGSANCGIQRKSIETRSQRLLSLVDWFERRGIRTRILYAFCNSIAHTEIVVKDFAESVDLNTLAIVSHTDFFRRLVFRQIEHSPIWESGYGYPEDLDVEMNDHFTILVNGNTQEDRINQAFDRIQATIIEQLEQGNTQCLAQ